jgi:hypothetical protein
MFPFMHLDCVLCIFLKRWDCYYNEEKYKEVLEDVMTTFHRDEEAHHDSMEDQAHKEHMEEEYPLLLLI